MSELFTTIFIPFTGYSFSDRGRLTRAEIIEKYKALARAEIEQAQKILDAVDSDFIVQQHYGLYAKRKLIEI